MVLDIRRYVKAVAKNILFEQNKEDLLFKLKAIINRKKHNKQ